MSKRVFLHVGSPKTGTTFLQKVLWAHRDTLRSRGLLLPGNGIDDHYLACMDVREGQHPGAWQRLVDMIAVWDGDALVSHELFASASPERVEWAIGALGDAEVHVIVTARDLVRQIPAEWQEHVKHRSTSTLPEFVDAVRNDGPGARWFWRVQDIPDVLDRWGHTLPRDRVHLVTVPSVGAGNDELWTRFAGLIGVDGSDFDLSTGRSNSSVRAEQAELLRRLNLQLGERLPLSGPYPNVVKSLLAHELLAGREGTTFGLVGEGRDFATQRSKEMVERLERLQPDVVGDLAELVPAAETHEWVSADARVSDEALLEEAIEALAGLLTHVAGMRGRLVGIRTERDRLRLDMQYRPLRHLLVGQSMRRAWVRRLHNWYRRGRNVARSRYPRASNQG